MVVVHNFTDYYHGRGSWGAQMPKATGGREVGLCTEPAGTSGR